MSDESDCEYVVGPSVYDEDLLRRLYEDDQMTIEEIADELDRGTNTIRKWMVEFGIERRQRGWQSAAASRCCSDGDGVTDS